MTRELIDAVACGQRAVYTAVEGLVKIGLLYEEREPYHNRRWFRLTEKGKQVAVNVQEIRMLLHEK